MKHQAGPRCGVDSHVAWCGRNLAIVLSLATMSPEWPGALMLPRLGLDVCGVILGLFIVSFLRMRPRYHSPSVAITAAIQLHCEPEGNRLGLTALCLIRLLKPSIH